MYLGQQGTHSFVTLYADDRSWTVDDVFEPSPVNLKEGDVIVFRLQSLGGYAWGSFQANSDIFEIERVPLKGPLFLGFRADVAGASLTIL